MYPALFLQAQNPSERKSAKAIVNMKVEDVSDNVPQFNQRSYIQDVAEDINWKANPVILTVRGWCWTDYPAKYFFRHGPPVVVVDC